MSDEKPMGQVIQIDEGRIRDHLGEMVRGTVEETLNAMLDAEADQLCGAGRYERNQARQDTRAGSYERTLHTSTGEVNLKVPKLRRQTFETAIIERYCRRSKNASRSKSILMRWRSEVNRSFFLCLAACRMRPSACDTLSRFCARYVVCCSACPLASALRSTGSAASRPALFTSFSATMAKFATVFSTSRVRTSWAMAPRLPDANQRILLPLVRRGITWFPHNELPHMPGSSTTPGRLGARATPPSVLPSAFATASAPGI